MSTEIAASSDSLLEIERQVRDLRVRLEAAERRIVAGWEVASTPPTQGLAAKSPEAVKALDFSCIDHLRVFRSTLSTVNGWCTRAAARAGFRARRCLESGKFRTDGPDILGLRCCFPIRLYCPDKPKGFWSKSSRSLRNLVGESTRLGQESNPPCSVHRSSPIERKASRKGWPVEL